MIESPAQQQFVRERLPVIEKASASFQQDFFDNAVIVNIPKGHAIASEGSACGQLAIVLSGDVRVYKLGDSGREITLYRIRSGDSCVLTASCIMSDLPFPAIAESESDVQAVVLPATKVRDWLTESKAWCQFVFALISKRLAEVISVLEEVTFLHMDERIAAYLIALAGKGVEHHVTHHQIAADLGTTREVVSRILKAFEVKNYIEMARGYIKINNLDALRNFRHEK